MSRELENIERYRQRAAELRAMAERAVLNRALLLKVAADYDHLALLMEEHLALLIEAIDKGNGATQKEPK